jgi:hypothetical protein
VASIHLGFSRTTSKADSTKSSRSSKRCLVVLSITGVGLSSQIHDLNIQGPVQDL